jgi:hypothetical protein
VRTAERVAYPTGRFSGRWTKIELAYAESQGTKIEEVTEVMVWPEERNVFRPWIEKLWALRANAAGGKSGPMGTFLKFYMNSLTGKLGSRPEFEDVFLNPGEVKAGMEPMGGGFYKQARSGVAKRGGQWVAGSPCAHVEWAAYLTSWGRVEWHKEAVSVDGGADVAYCDTDSLRCAKPRTRNVGKGLGEWLHEGHFRDFQANAPKFYRMNLEGKVEVKSKGVSATFPEEWDKLFSKGSHTFKRTALAGFKTSLRKHKRAFSTATLARKVGRGYGDRVLGPEGRTYPQDAEALGYAGLSGRQRARPSRAVLSAFEKACLAGSVG